MKLPSRVVFLLAVTAGSSLAFSPLARTLATATRQRLGKFSPSTVSSPSITIRSAAAAASTSQDAENLSDSNKRKNNNPTPILLQAMQDLVVGEEGNNKNKLKSKFLSTAMVAALALSSLTFAVAGSPEAAWAARSGGRMGGSFGSAPRMMSAPRSYGGGGGGYGGGYYGGGYRGGITVAPIIAPMPFYSPFGYGGAAGVMVSRGPSFFDLLLFGGLTLFVLNTFTSVSRGIASSGTSMWTDTMASVLGRGVTVAKVSIALEVPNRDDPNSILSVLERLAQTARTDSRVGVQNLTSQVAMELLRRKSSIVSAFTQSTQYNDKTKAQREFSLAAVQERGKFEQETVSRYGGVDYASAPISSSRGAAGDGQATMAVVTLVIAIDGDSTKLPQIQSIGDVEEALRRIASDARVEDCLQSAEILWTPEDRSETLTRREVIADYPELRTV